MERIYELAFSKKIKQQGSWQNFEHPHPGPQCLKLKKYLYR